MAARSACAALSWVWARAACVRASASSRTTSSSPCLTAAPSLTRTRCTLVEIGACASKLLTGSIFPLVEITLRILPCWTWAVRIDTASSWRETKAARITTPARTTSAVVHQRPSGRSDLFPFNGMRGKAQALMYHSSSVRRRANALLWTYLVRCIAGADCGKKQGLRSQGQVSGVRSQVSGLRKGSRLRAGPKAESLEPRA